MPLPLIYRCSACSPPHLLAPAAHIESDTPGPIVVVGVGVGVGAGVLAAAAAVLDIEKTALGIVAHQTDWAADLLGQHPEPARHILDKNGRCRTYDFRILHTAYLSFPF